MTNKLRVPAAILTICGATVLTSCGNVGQQYAEPQGRITINVKNIE